MSHLNTQEKSYHQIFWTYMYIMHTCTYWSVVVTWYTKQPTADFASICWLYGRLSKVCMDLHVNYDYLYILICGGHLVHKVTDRRCHLYLRVIRWVNKGRTDLHNAYLYILICGGHLVHKATDRRCRLYLLVIRQVDKDCMDLHNTYLHILICGGHLVHKGDRPPMSPLSACYTAGWQRLAGTDFSLQTRSHWPHYWTAGVFQGHGLELSSVT